MFLSALLTSKILSQLSAIASANMGGAVSSYMSCRSILLYSRMRLNVVLVLDDSGSVLVE